MSSPGVVGRKALPQRPSQDSTTSSLGYENGKYGSQDYGRGGMGQQQGNYGQQQQQGSYGQQQGSGGYGHLQMDRNPSPSMTRNNGQGQGQRMNSGARPAVGGSQSSVVSVQSASLRSPPPNGKAILEGYERDINNIEEERARYNPVNTARPQSSMQLNVNDPIQVHLLVETALGDSKEFEILAPEEVDELKKQIQSITQRIAQTRQNLAIQNNMRGAAISIAKLYTNKTAESGDKKSRRSLLGSRNSNNDQISQAEEERISSEKKCEELATELWSLEKRFMGLQTRLLQHTAGILQMTHKGPAMKKQQQKGPNGIVQQGMPGSPESMYTYSNARSSLEPPLIEDDLFDERSFYRIFDRFDTPGLGLTTARDSWDNSSKSKEQSELTKTIVKSELKFENLNNRLRDVIVKANPQRQRFTTPPISSQKEMSATPGKLLALHLDYLEKGIIAFEQDHSGSGKDRARLEQDYGRLEQDYTRMEQDFTRLKQEKNEGDMAVEETIEELNREIRDILLPFDSIRPVPPEVNGQSLASQLNYLQNSMGAIENELQRAASFSADAKTMVAQQDSFNQMEAVLTGLWDIIQAGEEDNRKRKLQRRQVRQQNGAIDEESSGEELVEGSIEPFSLQAFSSKVQWVFAQTGNLKDQKKVLQRQIKQQRELNSKGESEKDGQINEQTSQINQHTSQINQQTSQISQLSVELDRTQNELDKAEKETRDLQQQLQQVMERLNDARRESTQRGLEKARKDSEGAAAIIAIESKLTKRNEEISRLEEEIQDMKDDAGIGNAEIQSQLAESESKIQSLAAELQQVQPRLIESQTKIESLTAQLARAEEDAPTFKKAISDKEEEIERANMEVARLQTEVTIARAELDSAYGSRAQRAAEGKANPAVMKEIEDLTTRNRSLEAEVEKLNAAGGGGGGNVAELRRELSETIEEYEVMTKASIEWEKEREQLEGEVDKLRDERESLEQKLGDEQVRWLGMKSPGAAGAPGDGVGAGTTSTAVLKNEFKKMMRDTRAENAKVLRAEQAERRKLEDEIRTLKKMQGPGKSGLSQSMA